MPETLDVQKAVRNLREVNLFSCLDDAQLTKVARLCEIQFRESGDYLIHEGEEASDVFILLMGEVVVSKQLNLPLLAAVAPGTDRILSRLTSEHTPVLGETSLLSKAKRRATVRCVTDCALYRLVAAELKQAMDSEAAIGACVYAHLSEMLHQRLETANSDVVKLSAALVFALED